MKKRINCFEADATLDGLVNELDGVECECLMCVHVYTCRTSHINIVNRFGSGLRNKTVKKLNNKRR